MDGQAEAAKVAQAEAADLRQRLRLTEAELQATVAGSDCAAQDVRFVAECLA